MFWQLQLRPFWQVTIALLSAIAAGCTSTAPLAFRAQPTFDEADLTLTVKPQTRPGTFLVSGTADLPPGTELNVIAIRRLHLNQAPFVAAKSQPTYSILDYATVAMTSDRWQTPLTLWQVAPDGTYKEAWQLQAPELQLDVLPEDGVFFLVTLTPLEDLAAIEQQLAADNQRLDRQDIQTTAAGDRYLQTGQVVTVALPTGKTAPIGVREEDINGGWGNRFLELPDLPNEQQLKFPEQRQTNAPVMAEEFFY